jgi:transposase
MGQAVRLTREDHSAAELRGEAARCDDAAAARRMLALAMVKEGSSRTEAARLCGMDRQTLRDWVHRYNEAGLPGLADKAGRRGPKPRLTAEQTGQIAELVRQGPDLAQHGVVRWRRIDLARVIQARFGVTLAERTVGSVLRGLGFRRLSVRPRHPQQDAAAMEAHKKTSPRWSPPSSPSRRAASRSSSGFKTKPEWASKAA